MCFRRDTGVASFLTFIDIIFVFSTHHPSAYIATLNCSQQSENFYFFHYERLVVGRSDYTSLTNLCHAKLSFLKAQATKLDYHIVSTMIGVGGTLSKTMRCRMQVFVVIFRCVCSTRVRFFSTIEVVKLFYFGKDLFLSQCV